MCYNLFNRKDLLYIFWISYHKFINMSESRTELIAWLNDLLKLNYTKVEQCGTGKLEIEWKKYLKLIFI